MGESTVDVLLVGGGVAAASAAAELRHGGFTGTVTLATRELDAPYHRPPISKQRLRTGPRPRPFHVHPPQWWAEHDVELLTRTAVAGLDLDARTATLTNKKVLRFEQALLATGAMVRRLAIDGAGLEGIHYLRTPANAEKLRQEAEGARRVVLVGGSFIAVEVAASLAAQGHQCALVMQEEVPLERTFGPVIGGYVASLLRGGGVELVTGTDVVAFTGEGRVDGVRTADGTQIAGDLVVVGAGAVPDTKLGARAGLELGSTGGLRCDAQLRTSAPHVYAAGDVCEYESVVHGRAIRVEHERHAATQGVTAARNLLGAGVPHMEVPYFWTDIGDWVSLEYVGPACRWDEELVSGSIEAGDFTVWYVEDGRLVAALTAGRPDDLDVARELISAGRSATTDLYEVVKQRAN